MIFDDFIENRKKCPPQVSKRNKLYGIFDKYIFLCILFHKVINKQIIIMEHFTSQKVIVITFYLDTPSHPPQNNLFQNFLSETLKKVIIFFRQTPHPPRWSQSHYDMWNVRLSIPPTPPENEPSLIPVLCDNVVCNSFIN